VYARSGALLERLRSSLWMPPSLAVLAGLVAGTLLARIRIEDGPLLSLLFTGTPGGARELLSTVAGAMITVTALVFSLTVVALQLAAGQYSPRMMRQFMADRGVKLVLAGFLGTFAYTVAVLRQIRVEDVEQSEVVPSLAVTIAIVLVLLSLGLLVYFIQHLANSMRVEELLRRAQRRAAATARNVYGRQDAPRGELPEVPADALVIAASQTGYIQAVDLGSLKEWARRNDLVVRLRPTVGDHLVEGELLAWVWRAGLGAPEAGTLDGQDAMRRVDQSLSMGFERTNQQDVAFGLRQIVDIAVRALSPGLNDPTTAVEALDHLAVVLAELARREPGPLVEADASGVVRAVVPRPDFADYLALATDQIRRYGAAEPLVTGALLRMLGRIAPLLVSDEQRRSTAQRAELIAEDARRETRQPEDVLALQPLLDAVHLALSEQPTREPMAATDL
jgi:uncharacterized membrane protein